MVFKLVRTDTEDPFKIQLTRGTHLIGRGKFLDCEDKRVSRKHGELDVTDDAISVKALHSNPCFYIKKGTSEAQVLKQNGIVNLSHGDQFGLLPSSYWYELLHCSELDIGRSPNKTEENTEPFENQPAIKTEPAHETNGLEAKDEELPNCDMNETVVLSQRAESPSLISTVTAETGSPSLTPRETSVRQEADSVNSPEATDDQSTTAVRSDDSVNIPPKRSHSTEEAKDEAKKVKLEPDDQEIKQEPDATPGPSGDQGQPSSNNIPGLPPSPAKPVGRERCIYGASCYRRNPQHKSEFAHPTDPDWGPGERGECPFGARCMRRDPRHWQHHTHPPGVTQPASRPPAQPQRRKRDTRPRSRSDSSDSNDSPQASLIVTGKRKRKTIKRPSYSGSEFEEEEDPFGTDEEDEWVPGSQSQYTQDTQDDV